MYELPNFPHPGLIVSAVMEELGIGVRELASAMKINPSAISRLTAQKRSISADLAIRLSIVLGSTAEMWIKLQIYHDLQEATKSIDVSELLPLRSDREAKNMKVSQIH